MSKRTLIAEHPVPAFLADALEAPVAVPVDAAGQANALFAELTAPKTFLKMQLETYSLSAMLCYFSYHKYTYFSNKLVCSYLPSFTSLIKSLWVRPGAYPSMGDLKEVSIWFEN